MSEYDGNLTHFKFRLLAEGQISKITKKLQKNQRNHYAT